MMTKKYAVEGLDGYPNELAHKLDDALELNAALVEALRAASFWMEGQYSDIAGDCGVCGSKPPYHHGQCPKAQVDKALALVEGDKDG